MNDSQDETTFRSILFKTVTSNFCTAKGEEEKGIMEEEEEEEQEEEVKVEEEAKDSKPQKKAVTFKTGLVSERNTSELFKGALINIDQVIIFQKYSFLFCYPNSKVQIDQKKIL
jgi:hypothetical protein